MGCAASTAAPASRGTLPPNRWSAPRLHRPPASAAICGGGGGTTVGQGRSRRSQSDVLPGRGHASPALLLELETHGGHPMFTNGDLLAAILEFLACPAQCDHRRCDMGTLMSRSKTPVDINARGLFTLRVATSIPAYLSETHAHEKARLDAETRRKNLIRSSWATIVAQGLPAPPVHPI